MKPFVLSGIVALGIALAGTAHAQEFLVLLQPDDPASPYAVPPSGANLEAGVGVGDFVGGVASAMSLVGGTWQARAAFGTRSAVGFEVGYVGGAQHMRAPQVVGHEEGTLLRNGLETRLRMNLPLTNGYWLLVPHVFVGAGWSRFDFDQRGPNLSRLRSTDDIVTVPVGAGFSATYRSVVIGARLTYTAAFDEELVREAPDHGPGLDMWNVSASLGTEL